MPTCPLLAIPVFNEERHLLGVLHEARRYCDEILVIDDGSTDSTPALLAGMGRGSTVAGDTARRNAAAPVGSSSALHVITHAENRGYGKSLADAFSFARRGGYDWLITMDCDEQHEPAQIPCFLESAGHHDADIISGTRYPHGRDDDGAAPPDRRRINRIITAELNQRLGLDLTDAFCGFKAYRVGALDALHITVPGYAMPVQMWVQAARAGLRVRELPVRLIYNDPTRHFGGLLDDPEVRLRHYLEVLEAELAVPRATGASPRRAPRTCRSGDPCSTSRS